MKSAIKAGNWSGDLRAGPKRDPLHLPLGSSTGTRITRPPVSRGSLVSSEPLH
jgi:hypothetical protein